MHAGTRRMQHDPNPIVQATGVIPAGTAVLTVFGYPIADAVQAVMLVWGFCLVLPKFWQFVRWIRRGGWRDPA